jgi:pimeloyl-ACP methyl ester carboxylesterase
VTIRRAYADLPHGQVHYAACGDPHAPAVLLLHQTPRSWTEYREVLPLLGARHCAIAMDTPGFGASDPLPGPASIEGWAEVAARLLDALGVRRAHVVGHHTGGVIAVELAARHGGRVGSLVLSSTPYTDAAFRRTRAGRPPIDAVEPSENGDHLAALWRKRQAFYPRGGPTCCRPSCAMRCRCAATSRAGHRAVASYRMEERIAALRQPTLLLRRRTIRSHRRTRRAGAPSAAGAGVDIPGGMVPLPDQLPEAFAQAVLRFLDAQR